MKWLALPLLALTLAACSSAPKKSPPKSAATTGSHVPVQAHVPDAGCIGKYKPAHNTNAHTTGKSCSYFCHHA